MPDANPYAPPTDHGLSDREVSEKTRLGTEMARRGATRGKIVRELKQQQVNERAAEWIADRAISAHAFEKRMAGFGLIVLGVATIFAGWLWVPTIRLAIATAMTGLFFMGLGSVYVFHRAQLPKKTDRNTIQ